MKKIQFSWSSGTSDLFLSIEDGKPVLLDVEYDGEELHRMCGGRTYYISRSGCSGSGYFDTLGSLIPVGAYRVDTAYNNEQWFRPVGRTPDGKEVMVAVPYCSHTDNKSEVLRNHPTIIKVGFMVVYCDFGTNFIELLSLILSGKELPEKCMINGVTFERHGHRTLRRIFSQLNYWREAEERGIVLEHYNLCPMEHTPNPWEFFREELKDFRADWEQERMFQLLSVAQMADGTFVKIFKVDGIRYRGQVLDGNPLETGNLIAGWQRLAEDVLVRFYDRSNEAHLVVYAPAEEAYAKVARRLAVRMGEGEEFISFVSAHDGQYVEFEQVVPKVLYLLDPAAQIAAVRKGLAKKVREDVFAKTQWVDQ